MALSLNPLPAVPKISWDWGPWRIYIITCIQNMYPNQTIFKRFNCDGTNQNGRQYKKQIISTNTFLEPRRHMCTIIMVSKHSFASYFWQISVKILGGREGDWPDYVGLPLSHKCKL